MLNNDYILKKMEPYLNERRELSESEFAYLFSQLSMSEQHEIIDIMVANGIEYVDKKEKEKQEIEKSSMFKDTNIKLAESLEALTNEELCVLYQRGNFAALTAIIKKNERFIRRYVSIYMKSFRQKCLTEDDLYQEGTLGMMQAVQKFDSTLSFSFLTYCAYWIQQSITRAIVNTGFLIRIPAHFFDKMLKVKRYCRENPTATEEQLIEIIKQDGWELSKESLRTYIFYSERYLNVTSLNTPVGEENDTELLSFIPDNSDLPEQIVEEQWKRETISSIVSMLKSKEAEIITMRFGLDGKEPMTLEEIGNIYGVTRERVRQIENKALDKLRQSLYAKELKTFWEAE